MKSFIVVVVFLMVSVALNFDGLKASPSGGAWCNVTARPEHACQRRWNTIATSGCNNIHMITTVAINGQFANWIETASTDDCHNYVDDIGYPCEDFANEPSNLNCLVHVWGQIF